MHCKQKKCYRSFQTLSSFKKHVTRLHLEKIDPTNKQQSLCSNFNVTIPVENVSINNAPAANDTKILSEMKNKEQKSSLTEFNFSLEHESLDLVSKLYSKYSLPRNIVQHILDDFTNMLQEPIKILKTIHIAECSETNAHNMENMLQLFSNPFSNLRSEFLLLNISKIWIVSLSLSQYF